MEDAGKKEEQEPASEKTSPATSPASAEKKKKKKPKKKSGDGFEIDESEFAPVVPTMKHTAPESKPLGKSPQESLSRQKSIDEKSSTASGTDRSSSLQPGQQTAGGSTNSTNSSDLADFEVIDTPISGSSSYDDITTGSSPAAGGSGAPASSQHVDLPGISEESSPSLERAKNRISADDQEGASGDDSEEEEGGDGEKKKKKKKKKNKKQKAQYDPTDLETSTQQSTFLSLFLACLSVRTLCNVLFYASYICGSDSDVYICQSLMLCLFSCVVFDKGF